MSLPALPESAVATIEELAAVGLKPVSIWLIGSRANNASRQGSDTDLVVFAPTGYAETVRRAIAPMEDVDVLVLEDGDCMLRDVWKGKSIPFAGIQWRQTNDRRATYIGAKWVLDEGEDDLLGHASLGELLHPTLQAVRLWPK